MGIEPCTIRFKDELATNVPTSLRYKWFAVRNLRTCAFLKRSKYRYLGPMERSYEIRQNFFTLDYLSCKFEQIRRGEGRGLPLWAKFMSPMYTLLDGLLWCHCQQSDYRALAIIFPTCFMSPAKIARASENAQGQFLELESALCSIQRRIKTNIS